MSTVRVRVSSPDPFNGARGHDYIRLRGLQPKIFAAGRVGDPEHCTCAPCVRARLLPAVQQICAAAERRAMAALPPVDWRDITDERAHQLLEAEA